MSIIKRNEDYPLWPKFFNDFFDKDWMDFTTRNFSETNTTLPSINIKEDKEQFEVEMAAPGLEKDDFKINLDNNVLTISSEKKIENETKSEEKFTRREFSYQSFCRSFTLPRYVESEDIKAKYENGILKVTIPKKEEAKPKPVKQIEIL
jgi:HSP20 family protein